MKQITLFLLLCCLISSSVFGTHEVVADLSYRCLGGNQYEVKLEIYRHCQSLPAPQFKTISYQSTNCSVALSDTIWRDTSYEVTPICAASLPQTNCNGGSIQGYLKDTYLDTVNLAACTDWVLQFNSCCLNGVTNVTNAMSMSLIGEITLDNVNASCNNSAEIRGKTLNIALLNQPNVIDPQAYDADGDDLQYRLISLKGGTPNYDAGYAAQNPINNIQSFNPQTGRLEYTPNAQGTYYISYAIDEYRNGTLIATSYRVFFVGVTSGTGSTLPTAMIANIQGGAQLGDTIVVNTGDTVNFDLIFSDADVNDTVNLLENMATELPTATYTITGTNPVTMNIDWVATATGVFPFGVVYENANCPSISSGQLKVVTLYSTNDCVWAGDANYDNITNNFDLLPVGLGFGQTGPQRPNAGIDYDCEPIVDWGVATPVTNVDYKHSDTNGDGVVNANDTAAILQNWGLTHPRPGAGQASANAVPFLVGSTTTVPSAMLSLPVILGDTVNPVDSAYGIAFTINYDESLVKSNSVYMSFGNSWLGTIDVDLISVQKDFYNNGQIQVAITRTDQLPVMGSGEIGSLHLTIKDVIIKSLDRRLNLSISNVRFISQEEVELQVNTVDTDVLIETGTAVTDIELVPLTIAPNPATDFVQVQTAGQAMTTLNLYNTQGQLLRSFQPNNSEFRFEVAELPVGLYLVEVVTAAGRSTQKLIIR